MPWGELSEGLITVVLEVLGALLDLILDVCTGSLKRTKKRRTSKQNKIPKSSPR